jgi:hypothetical protein
MVTIFYTVLKLFGVWIFTTYFCLPEKGPGEVPEWPKGTVC